MREERKGRERKARGGNGHDGKRKRKETGKERDCIRNKRRTKTRK